MKLPTMPELPDPQLRGQGPVTKWYKGRSIFITGASGFMGKVLLEKLLYQCTELKTIYILLRPKRGKSPAQRIEDMWKLPMFHRIRKLDPQAFRKVIPLDGDIITDKLGLSVAHQQLVIDNVSVVFHLAATLRLEAKLKDAIEMNTTGTERVLDLVRRIKDLKVFVHLSTAFCSADLEVFKEEVYPSPDNPKDIMLFSKCIRDEALEAATEKMIHPHPNTYTYTKRLSETLVANEYPKMPVVIARPSIVTPAAIEPLPGWVDSLNGPMGITVGAGKGVIRSMVCYGENRANTVPVDFAISTLILLAWKMGSAVVKPPEVPVYNMTNDGVVTVRWGEILDLAKQIGYKYPFEQMIWYPDGDMRRSKTMHRIYCFFYHWIPAYLIDFLMLIIMQKRFMVRLMGRIDDGLELLQFFTTREWTFESKKFLALADDLTPLEKQIYPIDFTLQTQVEYMTIGLLGARQYLMKENLSTIPRCLRVQTLFYILHKAVSIAFYVGLIWMVYSWSDSVKDVFDAAGSQLQNVPIIRSLIPTTTSNL